jgi:hypothetical protein
METKPKTLSAVLSQIKKLESDNSSISIENLFGVKFHHTHLADFAGPTEDIGVLYQSDSSPDSFLSSILFDNNTYRFKRRSVILILKKNNSITLDILEKDLKDSGFLGSDSSLQKARNEYVLERNSKNLVGTISFAFDENNHLSTIHLDYYKDQASQNLYSLIKLINRTERLQLYNKLTLSELESLYKTKLTLSPHSTKYLDVFTASTSDNPVVQSLEFKNSKDGKMQMVTFNIKGDVTVNSDVIRKIFGGPENINLISPPPIDKNTKAVTSSEAPYFYDKFSRSAQDSEAYISFGYNKDSTLIKVVINYESGK